MHEFRFRGSTDGLYLVKVEADGDVQVIKLVKIR
jgi:hypothetical protein